MDKISKALEKLTGKEREIIKLILSDLLKGEIRGFDIKKLKGREDIFRVRKGKIRIIYKKSDDIQISILAIERRSENTYNF